MTPFARAVTITLAGLAGLLATPAPAAPAGAPELACLRLMATSGLSDHPGRVCAAVLARTDGATDPLARTALRRLLEERNGTLPASVLSELEGIPADRLATLADNPVFLTYVSRVVMAAESLPRVQATTLAQVSTIAGLALQQPALRTQAQLPHLQGLLVTTAILHMNQRDPEGALAWLARLEETCVDAGNCFELYTAATMPFGENPHLNSFRKLASLLAERHGIGDWRTGVVAMNIAGMLPPRTEDAADTRESIYEPFLSAWTKADVVARQPAAASWFVTIAGIRYERGDFRGAREAADRLAPLARTGRLHHFDMRRFADLAVNSRIGMGQYTEAMALDAEFAAVWKTLYAPRVVVTP